MNEQIKAQIEAAFREGYDEGYGNGTNDESDFERGHGSRSKENMKIDKDEAWRDSDSITYIGS